MSVGYEIAVPGLIWPNTPYVQRPDALTNRGLMLRSDDEPAGLGWLISTAQGWMSLANPANIPQPSNFAPPSVSEIGAIGSSMLYALANHTHASKVRKKRVMTDTAGKYTWVFDTPLSGVPIILGIAETALGVTDVINLQAEGVPTTTQCALRVTRSAIASVLGINVLSFLTAQATQIHLVALDPT